MKILNYLGIGTKKMISKNSFTKGIVTKVKTCWWIKINTKPIRKHYLDGAMFPHIIHFTYNVGEKEYSGSKYVSWNAKCPQVNDSITVYFNENKPSSYIVKI